MALRSLVLAVALIVLTAAVAVAQSLTGVLLEPDPGLSLNLLGVGADLVDQPAAAGFTLASLGQKLDRGPVGVGVNVAPVRARLADNPAVDRAATNSIYRLIDTDLRMTAIGLDLKLRWPSVGSQEPTAGPLQPYVSLGPALLVARGDESGLLNRHSPRPETSMSLGMKSALGLTWQLSKGASLFGEYRLIQDRFGLPGRPAGDRDHGGADLFYGFSLRF